jgi:O-acetyl-ADP-ribose deacetylase (regulator of RNase III)
MELTLVQGDITEQHVDAIVNAANSSLMGGGGVDGAIHRKGGPAILDECRQLRASKYGKGLPTGQAVATTGGRLPARFVIHTVGPVYGPLADPQLLRSCYTNSLGVADHLELSTVAFPLISSGIYGWPVDDAVRQAVTAIQAAQTAVTRVHRVLYDQRTYAMADRILTGEFLKKT